MRSRETDWLALVAGAVLALATSTDVRAESGRLTAGGEHVCVLSPDGGVRCWGSNSSGQLGTGNSTDALSPVRVQGLTQPIAAITAGRAHTCALTTTGTVSCWGGNGSGQLGDGTTQSRNLPTPIPGLSGVTQIAAGFDHTCARQSNGALRCWGGNFFGQLGDGSTTPRPSPTAVATLGSGVVAIDTGYGHTCALTDAATVRCWGYNFFGQLGDTTTTDRPAPVPVLNLSGPVRGIMVGGNHSCALMSAGGVECWGANNEGQLGRGNITGAQSSPAPVVGLPAGAISIVGDGSASDAGHTCALLPGGTVYCWGYNRYGQIGDGTTSDNRLAPTRVIGLSGTIIAIAAGASFSFDGHTCALSSGGGVQCWGDNARGELGNGRPRRRLTPVSVSGLSAGVQTIATGDSHTCASVTGRGALCWGDNQSFLQSGHLGTGDTQNRFVPAPVSSLNGAGAAATATQFALGLNHSCAVTGAGAALCWGAGSSGKLGDGGFSNRLTPTQVFGLGSGVAMLAVGYHHSCALLGSGAVRCWGDNSSNQVGNGSSPTVDQGTPTGVTGLASGVRMIAAGIFHTCALLNAGTVKCWGWNIYGSLGDNSTLDRTTPVDVVGLSGVRTIAAGYNHTCAVLDGGGVRCWGENSSGELGDGSTTQRNAPVDVLGVNNAVSIAAGGSAFGASTCVVTATGAARCWGANDQGQLGINSTSGGSTSPVEPFGLGSGVAGVAVGDGFACARLTSGGMACWGDVTDGKLGTGDSRYYPSPNQAVPDGGAATIAQPVLVAPAGSSAFDETGSSVATNDSVTAVGAPRPSSSSLAGVVYVYVRSGAFSVGKSDAGAIDLAKNTTPVATLTGGQVGDKFGAAVAMSPDGGTIAVGVPNAGGGSGRVLVYRRPGAGWSGTLAPALTLLPPTPSASLVAIGMGQSVSIDENGTIVAGAPQSTAAGVANAGAVFRFVPSGASYTAAQTLSAPAPQFGAEFGNAVDASRGEIAVGAPSEDRGAATDAGAAYRFPPGAGGSVGAPQPIVPSTPAVGDKFGSGVALAGPGEVAVGAPGADTPAGDNSGEVTVHALGGSGFTEVLQLVPASGADQGMGTALSTNGDTLVAGAPNAAENGNIDQGRVYAFELPDVDLSALAAQQKSAKALLSLAPSAVALNFAGERGDRFGRAVGVGTQALAIGVPLDDRVLAGGGVNVDEGRTNFLVFDRILRAGTE
jgi:alpha-tubulin suppressor-like RCC1 family protein